MAKFDDYTQKNTPEDNDITLILDKTANVNKKTPFSGIWTWIVNKMTNAVIQNLQTSNKTMIGAINELNSKTIFSDVINNSTTKTFTLAERGSYIVNTGILNAGNVTANSVSSYIVVTGDHSSNEGSIVRVHGDDRVSVSLSGNILTVTTTSSMWIICTVTKL